ncbi:MAG TPA: four helix bundle protein [Candidatus Magasanikbacteria bacterium]|nr:four helix bundle protein [Candidatus Magasanikbacteria bacterium]
MYEIQDKRRYDLEERTYEFAKRCRDFVKKISRTISNVEYGKQLVRSSGSTAANYIEANEAISKKDFWHRIKICRKEAKESRLWIRLIVVNENNDFRKEQESLSQESLELTKIFGAIIEKSK